MTEKELELFIANQMKSDDVAESMKAMITEAMGELKTGLIEDKPWIPDITNMDSRFNAGDYKDLGSGYLKTPQGSIIRTKGPRASMDPWVKVSPEMEDFSKVMKFYTSPKGSEYDTPEVRELIAKSRQKALTEGVDTAGGYLVPEEFKAQIMEVVINDAIFMSRAWRIPMKTDSITIPELTQSMDATKSYFGGITFVWTEEAATKSETEPTFGQLRLIVHKLAGIAYVSNELLADSAINFLNYITGLYSRAMRWVWDNYFINGTGAGQPLGIINDPNILVQARVTANRFKFADAANMDALLDEHFTSPIWLMRKATLNQLIKEVAASGDLRVMQTLLAGLTTPGIPKNILGYPVILTSHCPALGTKGDVILGDLAYYAIGMREELLVKTSEHYKFIDNLLTFLVESRFDGKPGNSEAFVILDSTAGATGYVS